jgi:hypothetical protein
VISANARGQMYPVNDLKDIPVVKPKEAGSYWEGIPHHMLNKTLVKAMSARGWVVMETRCFINATKTDIVLAYRVDVPSLPDQWVCARNSNNHGSFATGWGYVTKGGAPIATAGLLVSPKHTYNLDVPHVINAHLDKHLKRAHYYHNNLRDMQDTTFEESLMNSIILMTGKQRLLPWSHVGKLAEGMPYANIHKLLIKFGKLAAKSGPLVQLDRLCGFADLVRHARMNVIAAIA